MQYRSLGRTGIKVSPYCLGAMMFGGIGAVEASLRRLQTDHIDLYQIHRPSPDTDIEETLSVLTDLMRAGKVRAIGSSTFPVSEIVEAQWVAERRGLARFRTEQPPYSILDRGIEREVLPACEHYGMGVMVWSPLSKGMLTGRYRKGQALPDSLRVKVFPKQMSDEHNLEAVERLIPVAEAAGLSLDAAPGRPARRRSGSSQ
jgi:aryl-alcohol dehydrogenase-like predicted oxidoreductase